MAISTEKTLSTLCSISVGWLIQELFQKYAPTFADGVNWRPLRKKMHEDRRDTVIATFSELRDTDTEWFNELCGALNLIRIVAESKNIRKHMKRLVVSRAISGKFGQSILHCATPQDGKLTEPINLGAWFCVHEEDLRNEWDNIKQLALKEGNPNYDWTNFCLEPRSRMPDSAHLQIFEDELFGIFEKEKSNKFPVKVIPLETTRRFQRYCVSTAKDPIETFLALNGEISSGNDPTANTFLIDYYFNCELLSITYPDVIEASRVADLFADHVLGSKTTQEEPKVYLHSMRAYHSEEAALAKFAEIKKKYRDVKDISVRTIKFTIAENAKMALLRRSGDADKKNKAEKLPKLPQFRCEVARGDDIFAALRKYCTTDVRHSKLVDVFEVEFYVSLYDRDARGYLGREFRDMDSPCHAYTISVSPRQISFDPPRKEISNETHWKLLAQIKSELVMNELAAEAIAEEGH